MTLGTMTFKMMGLFATFRTRVSSPVMLSAVIINNVTLSCGAGPWQVFTGPDVTKILKVIMDVIY
jgi:hypothetical protein